MIFAPVLAIVAAVSVLGLSMGRKTALTTESQVIEKVATIYVEEGGMARTDCHARPARSSELWLVVTCTREGAGAEYFIDHYGRVADRAALDTKS